MADRSVSIALEAKVTGFVAGMRAAGRSVSGFMTELDKSTKKRKAFEDFGSAAGKVGFAAAAGLGAAVYAAANFDQAMSRVDAATHASAGTMEQLRKAALKAGADTVFSASEAADGIEALAKAGVSTNDILRGGLRGSLSLAAAGELDVGTAAEDAATAMTQFSLKGKDVPHVADLLAAAAGKAQGEVSDFSMALNQSGLVAHQTGLSIEETMGALGAFASQGLLGSDAGTSLKTFLLSLSGNSAQAKNLMDKLGFSAYDANGKFIGLVKTAQELRDKFSGLTDEQRSRDFKQIFGTDAIRAANVLYSQGATGIANWIKKVNDQGYAADTAARKLDNLKGDLEGLKGSLETALIGTGEGAQTPLRSITQGLTNVVNAYNKLPQGQQANVAKALGLTALAGIGTFAFTKVVIGINNAKNALRELGLTADAVKGSLSAVATLTVAGFAVGKIADLEQSLTHAKLNADDLHRSLLQLATGVSGGTTLFQTYGKNVSGMSDDFNTLDSNLAHVNDGLDRVFGAILPFTGSGDWSGLQKAQDNFKGMDEALAGMAEGGEARQASEAFARIQAEAKQAGVSTSDLAKIFPQYTAALSNAGAASKFTAGDMLALAHTLGLTAKQARNALQGMQRFSAFFQHREDIRSYHDALRGLGRSVEQNGNKWKGYGEKANANNRQLDLFGQTAIKVASDLKGAARQRFLTNAIQDLHTFAKEHNVPKAAIQDLIDKLNQLGALHPKPKASVDGIPGLIAGLRRAGSAFDVLDHMAGGPTVKLAGIDTSIAQLQALQGRLNQLHDQTIHVTTVESRVIGGPAPLRPASGGYIRGPGTTTSDSIPAMVSDREYVVRAAAVAKYGVNMMNAINAGRFATGGFVTRGQRHGSGSGGGGSAVQIVSPTFRLYDMDGQFVGSMRGEITDDHDMTATLRRQGVG